MQTKKTTMLAAGLVVAVIAMAGVGYAVSYTATTTNTNNVMDSTYLTVTQGSSAAYTENFLKNLYFDSENTALNSTTYTPVYTGNLVDTTYTATTAGNANDVALISNALTLTVTPTNSTATSADMKVTVTNFTKNTDLTYKMVISNANGAYVQEYGAVQGHADEWYFEGITISNTIATEYSVALYVSGESDEPTTGFPGSKTGQDPTPDASKAKFTFEITATVS